MRRVGCEESDKCLVCSLLTLCQTGMHSDFVVLEAYMIWEFLRKRIQNSKYIIKYKNEYLCRMRKEITTNYKHIKATNTMKMQISKNNVIELLFITFQGNL